MYFRTPFATAGDRTAIPNDVQPDGSVSFTDGYGTDYQLNPNTDPAALNIERDKSNWLDYEMTLAIQRLQQFYAPDWISSTDNGGAPFAYNNGAIVLYTDGAYWQSIVATNTAEPGTDPTKWILFLSNYATAAALAAAATTLQNNINAEATTRAAADTTLQNNINALPFHAKYVSAPTAFAYNTAVGPFTHVLGAKPFGVILDLICIATGDGNYAVGDTIGCPTYESFSTEVRGCRYLKTTTVISLRFGPDSIYAPDPSTNARIALTAAKWEVIVSAWV